jgi:serine/threonine-protein kinase
VSFESHLHAQAERKIGTLLRGKWRLERVLGVGGMGAVYEARHKNGKRVAVKMLHAHLAAEPRVLKRFVREGYVANALAHPSVVSIDDNDIDEHGNAFLVMELLRGESLEDRRLRAGGKLEASEVLPLFAMLLDVLVVASDQGIVHRDLKPENLFLHEDGSLRVVDFGLARAREVGLSAAGSMTNPDELLGTPAFMAPEQAIGRWDLVDPRTDVWAAGATMFTVLAGRAVHEGGSVPTLLVSAATKKAPPLASLVPTIHPAVARMVDRALTFSKADRPDARAVLADLIAAARALAIPLPDLPNRPPPASPPPSTPRDDDDDPVLGAAHGSLRRPAPSAAPPSDAARRTPTSHDAMAYSPTLASVPPDGPTSRGTGVPTTSSSQQPPSRRGASTPAIVVPVALLATVAGAGVAVLFLRSAPPASPARPAPTMAAESSASAVVPVSPAPLGSLAPNGSASASASRTADVPASPSAAASSHKKRSKAGIDDQPETDSSLLERRK